MSTVQKTLIGVLPAHIGDYDANKSYVINNIVFFARGSFICIEDVTGIDPTNAAYWRPVALAGLSGLMPLVNAPYASALMLDANTHIVIDTLTGAITLTLGPPVAGFANEWVFTVTQGATAQNVVLPVIKWVPAMPTFAANSTTEVRLYYVGSQLNGMCFT